VYRWADVIIIACTQIISTKSPREIILHTPSNVISCCVGHIVLQTVRIGVSQDLFQQSVCIIKPCLRLDEIVRPRERCNIINIRTPGWRSSNALTFIANFLLKPSRTAFSPSRDDSGCASILEGIRSRRQVYGEQAYYWCIIDWWNVQEQEVPSSGIVYLIDLFEVSGQEEIREPVETRLVHNLGPQNGILLTHPDLQVDASFFECR